MTPQQVFGLLNELCIQLGFCLPAEAYERLSHNPPGDADLFTYVVFSAEGLDPDADRHLRDRVTSLRRTSSRPE